MKQRARKLVGPASPLVLLLTILPFATTGLLISTGHAQVTTNLDALSEIKSDQTERRASQTSRDQGRLPAHRVDRHGNSPPPAVEESSGATSGTSAASPMAAKPHSATSSAPAAPPSQQQAQQRVGPPPSVPAAPPRPVVIAPPPVNVKTHPPVAPIPVVSDPKASGDAHVTAQGMTMTFGPESDNLNAAMLDALTTYAKALAKRPDLRVTIISFASGKVDDPSVPRRHSLARALKIRSVLIKAGVATTRIYPRAEGLSKKETPSPDRLEIIAAGAAPAPPADAFYPHPTGKTKP